MLSEWPPGFFDEWDRSLDWRVIHGMRNRAPFSHVLPPGAEAVADYRWNGQIARALRADHVMDGLLVSCSQIQPAVS
jgi:Protein of unknown function (DUF3696)